MSELTPEQMTKFKNNMSYFWDGFQFGAMFGILVVITIFGIWVNTKPAIESPERIKPIPGKWKQIPKSDLRHTA